MLRVFRGFLAIKHASAALSQVNESVGKTEGGGSIILTASGTCLLAAPQFNHNHSVQWRGSVLVPDHWIVSRLLGVFSDD